MPSPRVDAGRELAVLIQRKFAAAGFPKAMATIDAAGVRSGARHGIAVVDRPDLEYQNWGAPEVVWTVHLVSGPEDNYIAAWEQLDELLEVLENARLNIKSAKPAGYETREGNVLPAYSITLNPLE